MNTTEDSPTPSAPTIQYVKSRQAESSQNWPGYISAVGFPTEQIAVRWDRVGFGFVVIGTLHALLVFVLAPALLGNLPAVVVTLGFVPYLVGGLFIGKLDQEERMLEVFYASVIPALVLPFAFELTSVFGQQPSNVANAMASMRWLMVLAPTLAYVLTALFGCWMSDRVMLRSSEIH